MTKPDRSASWSTQPDRVGKRIFARWYSALWAVMMILMLTTSSTLGAETGPNLSATNKTPWRTMTDQEYQGMGCLTAGSLGAVGAHLYSDVVAIAVTGAANPALGVPFVVSGFAVGCGLGGAMAPALYNIYHILLGF